MATIINLVSAGPARRFARLPARGGWRERSHLDWRLPEQVP